MGRNKGILGTIWEGGGTSPKIKTTQTGQNPPAEWKQRNCRQHCDERGWCPPTSNAPIPHCHPIQPRVPAAPFAHPVSVTLYLPPPLSQNPSKTITLKSLAWHPSRFYFSSFSGKLNPLWHGQPAQLFQQRKHPQFREEEIMTNLCKIKTRNVCVCVDMEKRKAGQLRAVPLHNALLCVPPPNCSDEPQVLSGHRPKHCLPQQNDGTAAQQPRHSFSLWQRMRCWPGRGFAPSCLQPGLM